MYKLIMVLDKEVYNLLFWFAIAVTIATDYSRFVKHNRPDDFEWNLSIVSVVVIISRLFLEYQRWRTIKNSGAEFKFPDNCALMPCDEKMLTIDSNKMLSKQEFNYEAATGQSNLVNALYSKAHKHTVWGGDLEQIFKRNETHILLQERSIQIIFPSKDMKLAIGYTHVLPINLRVWNLFKSGTIRSSDLTESYIVGHHKRHKDDIPFGLLIIGIVLPEESWPRQQVSSRIFFDLKFNLFEPFGYRRRIGRVLTDALAKHLLSYCENEFAKNKVIPVIFESASKQVKKFVSPYKRNEREYSKDYAEIFCFDLKNPLIDNIIS